MVKAGGAWEGAKLGAAPRATPEFSGNFPSPIQSFHFVAAEEAVNSRFPVVSVYDHLNRALQMVVEMPG